MSRNDHEERAAPEMVRGAGVTAVLALLAEGDSYGWELAEHLAERSDGFLDLGQATLYPLLYNLESKGLVTSRRQRAESGRMRKYYRLSPAGAKALRRSRSQWRRLVRTMANLSVLDEEQPT